MLRFLPLLLLLCVPLAAQSKEAPKPLWAPPAEKPLAEMSAKDARAVVTAFKKAIKSKDIDAREQALRDLVKNGRHPTMVKPVVKLLTRDPAPRVRELAAKTVGRIARKDDRVVRMLWSACGSRHNKGRDGDQVREAAAAAMGKVAKKSIAPLVAKTIRNGIDRHLVRGAIIALGHAKDVKGAEELAKWVERPEATNVNSASNPPASYWKARWQTWEFVHHAVEWSLWSMSGRIFEEKKQVLAWLDEPRKKRR